MDAIVALLPKIASASQQFVQDSLGPTITTLPLMIARGRQKRRPTFLPALETSSTSFFLWPEEHSGSFPLPQLWTTGRRHGRWETVQIELLVWISGTCRGEECFLTILIERAYLIRPFTLRRGVAKEKEWGEKNIMKRVMIFSSPGLFYPFWNLRASPFFILFIVVYSSPALFGAFVRNAGLPCYETVASRMY